MFLGSDAADLASSSVFDALQKRKNQAVINIHNDSETLNIFTRTSRQISPPLTLKSRIKRYVSAQPDSFFGVRKWQFGEGGGVTTEVSLRLTHRWNPRDWTPRGTALRAVAYLTHTRLPSHAASVGKLLCVWPHFSVAKAKVCDGFRFRQHLLLEATPGDELRPHTLHTYLKHSI